MEIQSVSPANERDLEPTYNMNIEYQEKKLFFYEDLGIDSSYQW